MKRLIALLLAISLSISGLIFLSSCKPDTGENPPSSGGGGGEGQTPEKPGAVIFKPEYKDYGRGTVDFSSLTYTRPNISAIIDDAEAIQGLILSGEESFDEITKRVDALGELVESMLSMRALAEIYSSRDSSVEFWVGESEYIETNYPKYLKAVKDMMVAAANSPDAERYESDCFGEGLIEEYKDGSDYTDEVVALLTEEARLEAIYSGYSTESVVIKDDLTGSEGTVDELLAEIKKSYGEESQVYKKKEAYYLTLYEARVLELSASLFVDLVKVRRQIADELSLGSYSEFAYREMGYEYTPQDTERLLSEISSTVLPIYTSLYTQAFRPTMQQTMPSELDRVALINTLYEAYEKKGGDLSEIYSYMLQHTLYDVEGKSANRFDGAFTVYHDTNASPFIFMSTAGYTTDLGTLSHEFGHFVDNYLNNGASSSLDTAEVSSQGLEFLSLLLLKEKLSAEQYRYLEYEALSGALETLLYQGFYSSVEHRIYKIPYDMISRESITEAVKAASVEIFGFDDYDRIEYAMIPHTILYPHYVQSYCTSVIPALEILFLEIEEERGFEVYLDLVKREESLTFTELLTEAGLSSPFEKGVLKEIVDEMHYYVLGTHYFKECDDDYCNAA